MLTFYLFYYCIFQMDDIAIPMVIGNMEDIVQSDPSQSSSGDNGSTAQLYEREAR